jgi:hypothetical protein
VRIPTILSDGGIQTGPVSPRFSSVGTEAIAASGRAIAGGLEDLNRGVQQASRNTLILNEKMKQRQAYDDHLYSEQKLTEAQRNWIQWTQDVQKNGSEDVVEQFNQQFANYKKSAIDAAPTKGSKDQLGLKLDDLGTQTFHSALQIEAANRSKNTVSTIGKMLDDSTDIIAQSPEMYAAEQNKLQSTLAISLEQKRISPEIGHKIQDQINNLGANAAEAMIPTNPQRAKEILDGVKGIEWQRRRAIEHDIAQATTTNQSLFHYDQVELAKSNFGSIMATGKSVEGFSVDRYASSFPAKSQEAAKKEALQQIDIAKNVYVASTVMKGMAPAKIGSYIASKAPVPGSPDFASQSEVFKHLQQVADQQMKLAEKDPFSYSRQDPIVNSAWKLLENLPQDAKPELRAQLGQQAMDVTVNYQKSIGIPDGNISVMSNDMAKSTAEQLNQGDSQAIQQTFQGLMKTYGKHYANAFRDMARLPEGQRIGAELQVVALHLGEPFLADFITASKTKKSDFKIESADAKIISEKLSTNPSFMAFSSALTVANPGNISYVDDFHQAIDKYATSLLFRGKVKNPSDAVKQASDLIIKNAYTFTEVSGSSIAVKRNQDFGTISDDDAKKIPQAVSEWQKGLSADKIDTSRFVFPENISDSVKAKSISDTIQHDSFWSTNPQNDGIIMYMNGAQGTVAPVKYKDGKKVEIKFKDLISYPEAKASGSFTPGMLPQGY